ncbi:single-stranded DNA-binding protein [Nocardia sp. CDC159]|uniref:Single-stranded DNA-binding protein n=1 Tax=Nocardia pulmonis TaxID=2951408 RepID=A0A9X2J138_9NOCA|nr:MULTISPECIES: single-stranded DNA-binding protein [Nocardia]MCM6777685.1 single-stranded DNA-binding protein [Nocardia pulmonis]MCM6790511.1 single-stranded DNA-binding protein [Nocardia sp. CDC159]
MYETTMAVIGNVVTHPVRRSLPGGEQVVTFRMASNSRRYDREAGDWVDSGTLFLTVNCWRRLVEGVDASIRRGDPVIAYGQLRTTEYRTREGVQRRDLELRASAVGPDLARCTAAVTRHGPGNFPIGPAVVDQVDDGPQERPRAESGAFDSVEAPRDDLRTA